MAEPWEKRVAELEQQLAFWTARVQAMHNEMTTLVPAGTIVAYGGSVPPPGWLFCSGEEKPLATFSALGEVLKERFGRATKEGHFVLPNLSGRVPVGAGKAASGSTSREPGTTYGADIAKLTPRQLPQHQHGLTPAVYEFNGDALSFLRSPNNAVVAAFPYVENHGNDADAIVNAGRARRVVTQESGGGEPFDLSQPSLVVNYIIKF